MHPGAHHYRIHLWDGAKPACAEKSAAAFGKTAPGIAHAWHMPGHTYTGLQRYADAAYQQEASARVDHAYMIRDRVMPFEIHNYAHNNQWLVTSLSHVGRVRDAVAVARNLVEQPRDPNKNGKNDGGSAQRNGRLRWSEVLARYELWDDLIAADDSGALDWSDVPDEQQAEGVHPGPRLRRQERPGKLADQIAALKALQAEDAKAKRDVGTAAALAELEGYQLLAQGELGPAFERFAKATAMRPEALARAHLAARNYGFAESAAKDAVDKQPEPGPAARRAGRDPERRRQDQGARRRRTASSSPWPGRPTSTSRSSAGSPRSSPPGRPRSRGRARRDRRPTRPPPTVPTWRPSARSSGRPSPPNRSSGDDTDGEALETSPTTRGGTSSSCSSSAASVPTACSNSRSSARRSRPSRRSNTDVVALGTDDLAATRRSRRTRTASRSRCRCSPTRISTSSSAIRAYDDFEGQPLHGTFLIDAAGNVRFQRVSSEPFLDVDFIKAEAARVNRLLERHRPTAPQTMSDPTP